MKRRDLVAGLALAAGAAAEEHVPESLYIPRPHLVEDRQLLHDFMDEFSFVDLVTCSPEIRITHIPVILDRNAGKYGTLYGHVSRQNPQGETFDALSRGGRIPWTSLLYLPDLVHEDPGSPDMELRRGPRERKAKAITDEKVLYELLLKLVGKFEPYEKAAYDLSTLPDSFKYGMIGGIIGFEMEIERLECKFKLGQERSDADRESILRNLQAEKPERSIYDLTAGFYKWTNTAGKK